MLIKIIREILLSSNRPSDIDYKALSKVRITRSNIHPDVKRVNVSNIQLYTWDNFLSSVECNELIKIINENRRPSTLTYGNGDAEFRTSTTCDLAGFNDSIIHEIDLKISKALGIYLCYSEALQGQHYDIGQEFKPHTDYFEPDTPIFDEYAATQGQRTWTFMIYLKDTEKGGGTRFVNIDRTFYPKLGQAIIWNNPDNRGRPKRDTVHQALKVESGTKIIITKWFRERGEGPMLYPV